MRFVELALGALRPGGPLWVAVALFAVFGVTGFGGGFGGSRVAVLLEFSALGILAASILVMVTFDAWASIRDRRRPSR